MARVIRSKEKWHRITIQTDRNDGELLLVKGGEHAYLWAGRNGGANGCVTVSGVGTLRRLAVTILREISPEARRGGRVGPQDGTHRHG